jgi:bacterioferritin-associated ferredoxin
MRRSEAIPPLNNKHQQTPRLSVSAASKPRRFPPPWCVSPQKAWRGVVINCYAGLKGGGPHENRTVHFRERRHLRDTARYCKMIVCSCNVFTDHDVRSTLSSGENVPRTTGQVYHCLGCSAQCGRCARTIRRIMDEALAVSRAAD